MVLNTRKATRKLIPVKIALIAPSGGGKTYGGLRLATGMKEEIELETGKEAKILMANTEGARGEYYADEFDYDIVDVEAPHNPEKYVELIQAAIDAGYDILIIDSSSHEWEGKGGCLELQQKAGGTYQSWAKVTPRHNRFIEAIADSPIHIIATMRGKDQYEIEKNDKGKTTVKKLGVGSKQREGFEYEFTATFMIDQKTNMAEAQKDNTHIFDNETAVQLSEEHGRKLIKWANSGKGFAPTVKTNVNTVEKTEEDDIKAIKQEIIKVCTELGGQKNKEMMDLLKTFVPSGNPNAIRTVDKAKECLEALKKLQ